MRSTSSRVTCKSNLRRFILLKLEELRPHLGIERVSESYLQECETYLKLKVINDIPRHPSKGKTFRP